MEPEIDNLKSEIPAMPIKAIAGWFGGKRTLATIIAAELGPHKSYWEPACGSMAVLFAKEQSSHETVNDLHGDVTNLACVIASDRAGELYDRLQRTLMCEQIILHAKTVAAHDFDLPHAGDLRISDAHLDRAYWYFVITWAGRNGVSGTHRTNYQMAVRWTSGGGSGAVRFRSATESLPAWHQRLRGVEILRRDLFEVLPRIDDQEGTAIYLDPPYLRGGGRCGSQAYLYEFVDSDHKRLSLEATRFRRARVVISYYDSPVLAELYPTWMKVCVYGNKNLHIQNRRGSEKTEAPEVLLINGPSLTGGGQGSPLPAQEEQG